MHAVLLLLASAAVGVEWGYRPLSSGGIEYIVQLEPQALEQLARGGPEIIHTAPPELRDIRKYRVTVGKQKLPRGGRAATPATQVAAEGVQVTPATLEADGREHIVELDASAIDRMQREMDLVYDVRDVRRFRIRLRSQAAAPSPVAATPHVREAATADVELAAPPASAKAPATFPSAPTAITPPSPAPLQPIPQRGELPTRNTQAEPLKIEIPPAVEPPTVELTEPPQLPFRAEPKAAPAPNVEGGREPTPTPQSVEPFPDDLSVPNDSKDVAVPSPNSDEPNGSIPARRIGINEPPANKPLVRDTTPPGNGADPFSAPGNPLRAPPGLDSPPIPNAPLGNSPPPPFPDVNTQSPALNNVPPLETLPPLDFGAPSSAASSKQPPTIPQTGNPFASPPPLGNQLTGFSSPATEAPAAVAVNPRSLDIRSPQPPPAEVDASEPSPTAQGATAPSEDNKPWWGVTGALLALFASLGGNAYLGWMNFDLRRQYASLLDMLKQQRIAKGRAS